VRGTRINGWIPAAAAVLSLAACTQSYGLFQASGSDTSSSASGGTTSASSGGGSSTQTTTASSGGGSTTTSGGGTTGTGGTGGMGRGGMMGSGGGDVGSVDCGGTPCDTSAGAVCCFTTVGQTFSCESSGTCGGGQVDIFCDGPEDCPGQVCCGNFQFNNYTDLSCVDDCGNEVPICGPGGSCSGGDTCQQSGVLPTGYFVCN
jgi:hypothetical protein